MNSAAPRFSRAFGSQSDAAFVQDNVCVRLSRSHLLARGIHIDLTTLAEQLGFRVRVFIRREAFNKITEGQTQFGENDNDLMEMLLALRRALSKAPLRDCPVLFQVGGISVVAQPGPTDHDDPRYALTLNLVQAQNT
jgi:hypothetical protein